MIRLTLALLTVMFLTFVIAGADRGQVRYGLLNAVAAPISGQSVPANAVVSEAEAEVTQAVFVPAAPVVDQPVVSDDQILAASSAEQPADVGTLVEPDKLVLFVSVSSANVREGPSKDFAVIDKLSRGEAVTVVSASETPEGWTLIQIEGDGLQGYISNALLAEQP